MHRTMADGPQTAGRILHGARWYDLIGRVMTLGRDKAWRAQCVELAAPVPGEQVLDIAAARARSR